MTAPVSGAVRPSDFGGDIDAYCSTGTSPGRGLAGRLTPRLELDHLGVTETVVRYEVHGPPDAPAVVVLGGISAERHLGPTEHDPSPGWWPGVVGSGAALDTHRFRVVGVDYLGGPHSPLPGRAPVTTADQGRAVSAVLDHLGVARATLVGASYGGMVELALALHAPARVTELVLFCAAHRTHPMATAVRSLQRDVTRLGQEWGHGADALALARGLAMTTYRSSGEFEARFRREWSPGPDGRPRFPVEAYLDARGRAFAERFPAESFLRLSESIDLHDVDPSRLRVPTTLVSWDSDGLVPPWLVEELSGRVAVTCRHVELSSPFGHDAFLKETRDVCAVLRSVLDEEVTR